METATDKIMCPSARAKPGAQILGIRQTDGSVAILPQTLPVNDTFIELAAASGKAEERFRFTNKCVEGGCTQWTGNSCGVAERVLQFLEHVPTLDTLFACAIRPKCRWFLQSGAEACTVCSFVITEISEADVEEYLAKMPL
jgi:hypothetical protein